MTYANSITKHNPVTGEAYHPTPIAAFVALATKFLQVNPGGTIPTTPPASSFVGDNITVTATGASGKVTFAASGTNSANVKTELLLQPLASRFRTPQKGGYRSKFFMAFASGVLSKDVAITPGWYAAGYRFVNTVTGQETPLVPISVQQVTMALEIDEPAKMKKAA